MCAEKSRRGRPRIYGSLAERRRAERARAKIAGCKDVRISLPEEYKTRLDTFCAENKLSLAEAVCYLLDSQSGFSDSTSPTQIKSNG